MNREKLKEQKVTPYQAVLETAISGQEWFMYHLIDFLLLFGLTGYGIWYSIRSLSVFSGMWPLLLYTFILLCLIILNGGHTVGMLVMGIRYVDIDSLKIYTGNDYASYLFHSFWERFKYQDAYEVYQSATDSYHQSTPMRKNGQLVVNKKMFMLFKSDYTTGGRLIIPKKTIDKSAETQKAERIFSDHEE
mgnify:CR=1 FL=1